MTTLEWHDDELLTPEQRAAVLGPGAPFEIVEEDVQGARVQVFARRPRNVRVMLEEAAENFGDRPFFVFPEQTITFAEMPGIVGQASPRCSPTTTASGTVTGSRSRPRTRARTRSSNGPRSRSV